MSTMRTATLLGTLLLLATGAPADEDGEPGSAARTRAMVELFRTRFEHVGPSVADDLDQLYSADIRFRDSITTVSRLPDLRRYFGETASGARFRVTDVVVQPGEAVVFSTMETTGPDGEAGRQIDGVSHLRVRDRVHEERDYFDLGEIYEQVPVVGWLTGLVKSRLGATGTVTDTGRMR